MATCGHCKTTNQTVAHVRSCAGLTTRPARFTGTVTPVLPAVSIPAFVPAPVVVQPAPAPRKFIDREGIFFKDGDVFRVKPSKRNKGRLYAERLVNFNGERVTVAGEHVKFEFEFAPGAMRLLSEDDRMSIEDAKSFMLKYSSCLRCNRHLRAAKSVERSVGPVCIKYFAAAGFFAASATA